MSSFIKANQAAPSSDAHTYWNGDGGTAWLKTMDASEQHFRTMTAALLTAAAPKNGEVVLDVGCGGGVTSRDLALAVAPDGEVVGADVSGTILEVARQRHGSTPLLSFVQVDVVDGEFPAQHFDLIYSRLGTMFFDHPVAALSNLRRALKPDGRMVFMCWRAIKENPWLYDASRAAVALLPEEDRPKAPADPFAPGPFSMADPQHLDCLLTEAGFSSIEIEPLDDVMHMGEVGSAIEYLLTLGPLRTLLEKVTEKQRGLALAEMKRALMNYVVDGVLEVPSATWIVTARR